MSKYNGPTDENNREDRLDHQHEAIKELMSDGVWRTLQQISTIVEQQKIKCPPASASAQLRHLRKSRFGGYKVERRHIKNGLYEYRLDVAQPNDRVSPTDKPPTDKPPTDKQRLIELLESFGMKRADAMWGYDWWEINHDGINVIDISVGTGVAGMAFRFDENDKFKEYGGFAG